LPKRRGRFENQNLKKIKKKIKKMKSTLKFSPLFLIVLLAFSCGSDSDGGLDAKKAELEKLKAQSSELAESIMQLEAELAGMDPDFAKQRQKTILIS
jgi:hypothetical protein